MNGMFERFVDKGLGVCSSKGALESWKHLGNT